MKGLLVLFFVVWIGTTVKSSHIHRTTDLPQSNDNSWASNYCQIFKRWYFNFRRDYVSEILLPENCERDAITALGDSIKPFEITIIPVIAELCVGLNVHHSKCLDFMKYMVKNCWTAPILVLFIIQLKRTDARHRFDHFIWTIIWPDSNFLPLKKYLQYRLIPHLNASLCVYEIALLTNNSKETMLYQFTENIQILDLYMDWWEGLELQCNCSEIITIRALFRENYSGIYLVRSKDLIDMKMIYDNLCSKKRGKRTSWTVFQLERWRSGDFRKEFEEMDIRPKLRAFTYLSDYSGTNWMGSYESRVYDKTLDLPVYREGSRHGFRREDFDQLDEETRRLLYLTKDNNRPHFKTIALSAGLTISAVKELTTNRMFNYLHETCLIRIIQEVFLNPKYSNKIKKKYWHVSPSTFDDFIYKIMRFVNLDLKKPEYGISDLDDMDLADCDQIIWEFLKIQKVFYEQKTWTYEDMYSLLDKQNATPTAIIYRSKMSLNDYRLCLEVIARVEGTVYKVPPELSYAYDVTYLPRIRGATQHHRNANVFRDLILSEKYRYLCYRHVNSYKSTAAQVFYDTKNQF